MPEPLTPAIRVTERCPQFGLFGEVKIPGHHADNRVLLVVEHHRPTDHRRVRPEPPLPQTVAQDNQSLTAQSVFASNEHTPEHRPYSERGKHAVGGAGAFDPLGPIATGNVVCRAGEKRYLVGIGKATPYHRLQWAEASMLCKREVAASSLRQYTDPDGVRDLKEA